MARIYADLIIKGKKTIDDVPEELKEEVIKILMEQGFVPGDTPLPETNE